MLLFLSCISGPEENASSINEYNGTTYRLRIVVIQEHPKHYQNTTRKKKKKKLWLMVFVNQALYKAFLHFVLSTVIKFPTERLEDQD